MRMVKGLGHPETGGCLMSIVGWLAGEPEWTDNPSCVCPTIRPLARWLNDRCGSDEARHRVLTPLVDLLMGTANPGLVLQRRQRVVVAAVKWARLVLHHVPAHQDQPRLAIEAAERWALDPSKENACRAHQSINFGPDADQDEMPPDIHFEVFGACSFVAGYVVQECNVTMIANALSGFYLMEPEARRQILDEVFDLIVELANMGVRREMPHARQLAELPAYS